MSHCGLEGKLPSHILHMWSLETLDLSFNSLNGVVPRDWEYLHMFGTSKLKHLDLSHNLLEGINIDKWANNPSLTRINLGSNRFSGTIPVEMFDSRPNLQRLHLNDNIFTGSLNSVSSIGRLEIFDVSNNLLIGSVPHLIMLSHGL